MDHLCFFLSCVCYDFVRVFYSLWSPAGKGLWERADLLALVCDV